MLFGISESKIEKWEYKKDIKSLTKALSSEHNNIRKKAALSLINIQNITQSVDVDICVKAIRILSEIPDKGVLNPLIEALTNDSKQIVKEAVDLLPAITAYSNIGFIR